MPPSEADAHHWIPRTEGGRETGVVHRICHRQVHALFSEVQLARELSSPDALRAHPAFARFVSWVQRKPPAFSDRVRKSRALRSRLR